MLNLWIEQNFNAQLCTDMILPVKSQLTPHFVENKVNDNELGVLIRSEFHVTMELAD